MTNASTRTKAQGSRAVALKEMSRISPMFVIFILASFHPLVAWEISDSELRKLVDEQRLVPSRRIPSCPKK